jgi:hypothetical protein
MDQQDMDGDPGGVAVSEATTVVASFDELPNLLRTLGSMRTTRPPCFGPARGAATFAARLLPERGPLISGSTLHTIALEARRGPRANV